MITTRLLSDKAKRPCFMTTKAACADVFLPADIKIKARKAIKIPLDIAFDIPDGYKVVMYPRSSSLIKRGLMQPVSVIEPDYHGNVHVPVYNTHLLRSVKLKAGERLAQIELVKCSERTDWNKIEADRDQNGFGGTGK